MAEIVVDRATVESAGPGLVLIRHVQTWSDGNEMGGELVLEASAASWLADAIDSGSRVERAMPPDELAVKTGGTDWEPIILLYNWRDPGAPRGRTYSISMRETTARSLAPLLRAWPV